MEKLTSKHKHTVKVGNHPHTNMVLKPATVRRGESIDKHVLCHTEKFTIRKHMFLNNINCIYKFAKPQNANVKDSSQLFTYLFSLKI